MSHIAVHLVTELARTRLDHLGRYATATPQPKDHDANYWNDTRARPVRGNYRQQIRPRDIRLGEIIEYGVPGAADTTDAAPRRAAAFVPRQMSVDLHWASDGAAGDNIFAMSSQAIPFPWAITTITWDYAEGNNVQYWNVVSTAQQFNDVIVPALPEGPRMWEPILSPKYTVNESSGRIPIGPRLIPGANVYVNYGTPYGGLGGRAGDRLTLLYQRTGALAGGFTLDATFSLVETGGGAAATVRSAQPSATEPAPPGPWIEVY